MSNLIEQIQRPLPKVFGSPLRYIQGPGALEMVGQQAAQLGTHCLLVADRFVLNLVAQQVEKSCEGQGVQVRRLEFAGEVTWAEINRLATLATPSRCDVVIASGGGKGIDAGKALAKRLSAKVITLPTVASNDSPTSKIFVMYDEQHRLLSVEHMVHNPAAVIVDTQLIAKAPRRLLLAGIGDALTKRFEVTNCHAAGGKNIFGGRGTHAALALAKLSDHLLREHAIDALRAVERGEVDVALETAIEATVLLSGLCFENGGLSIAHAMTRGLTAMRGTKAELHGLQVAYGLLVQLILEKRTDGELERLLVFYRAIGLPCSLRELGMSKPDATPDEIQQIATDTMTAPHVKNFPYELNAGLIAQAMAQLETRMGN